jgi:hypothetical protein
MSEEQQKFALENEPGSGEEQQDGGESDSDDKRKGRRKIDISFIENKSRRHITFSKRKAGIMKKAYELATLTGTQVLLLVASETGHVYTFATPKLQPLITNPEGKNLIQACLNAPDQAAPEPPKTPATPQPPPQTAYAATPEPDRGNKGFPHGYPPQVQTPQQMNYDPKYLRPKQEPPRQMDNNINFPQMGMPPMQNHPGMAGYPMPAQQYSNSQFFPRQGQPGPNSMPQFPGQQQQQGQQQLQHPAAIAMGQQMYQGYGRPQQMAGFPHQMQQMHPQMDQSRGGGGGHEDGGSEDD